MSNVYDPAKSAHENMVALVNASNGINLANNDVEFSPVAVNAGALNSKVTMTAVDGNGFSGAIELQFNRVDIGSLTNYHGADAQDVSEGYTVQDVIDAFAAATNIPVEDLYSESSELPAPPFSETDSNIVIKVRPESYAAIGEFTVELDWPAVPVGDVITVTDLAGWADPTV